MSMKDKFADAMNSGEIVRVYSADRETGWVEGFIVDVGTEFFAIEVIEDASRLDGFHCRRFEDVSEIKIPAPHHEFIKKALRLRKIERSPPPSFNLSSLQGLLATSEAGFPLTTIHFQFNDGEYSEVCYIGNVISVSSSEVTIKSLDPDGKWEDGYDTYPLLNIWRVDYGGDYERSLAMVAADST